MFVQIILNAGMMQNLLRDFYRSSALSPMDKLLLALRYYITHISVFVKNILALVRKVLIFSANVDILYETLHETITTVYSTGSEFSRNKKV